MGSGDAAPAILEAIAASLDLGPYVMAEAARSLASDRAEPSTPLRDWAGSGAMALTGPADGPPLAAPGAMATGVRTHLAVLAATARARGAAPPRLPGTTVVSERAALTGFDRNAPESAGGAFRCHRTRDGWVGLSLARPDDLSLLPALTEREMAPPADPASARALVDAWAAQLDTEEAAERIRLLGLPGGRIPDGAGGDDPQTAHRRARGAGPGTGVLINRTDTGTAPAAAAAPHVVDFSALWAGPLCAHLLGLTGATVTKVEFAGRLDGARNGSRDFYDLLHHGHRSVVVDVSNPSERSLLAELVRTANVVIEGSRPRALRALGLDAEESARRGTVWVSITAYGRTGPWSGGVGFGDDVAAAAGAVVLPGASDDNDDESDDDNGYRVPPGLPSPCADALADPVTGVLAAAAASAALADGRGALIDVSMHGAVRDLVLAAPAEPHEVVPDGRGWRVRDARGEFPVVPPRPRAPRGPAATAGQHDHLLGRGPGS